MNVIPLAKINKVALVPAKNSDFPLEKSKS
jgi:hypothetical protein